MTAPPKNASLIDKLDQAAIALLEKTYGDIMGAEKAEGVALEGDPVRSRPDVFNAIVNWVRVKNKLELDDEGPSELDRIAEKMNAGRKR